MERHHLTFDIMYNASFNKDASFEGHFLDGSDKNYGIFCRPTLPKIKPENVEFFNNTKDAFLKGYRPSLYGFKPLKN